MSLSLLKENLRLAQTELKKYMIRQEQVSDMLKAIPNCGRTNQSKINPNLIETIDESNSGIKECANIEALNETLSLMKEKEDDLNIGESKNSMQLELNRVNDEISRLRAEINSLRQQIAAELEILAQAQDVIAETAMRSVQHSRLNSDGTWSYSTSYEPDTARRSAAAQQAKAYRAEAESQLTAARNNHYFV